MDKRIEKRIIRGALNRHAAVEVARTMVTGSKKPVHVDDDTAIDSSRNGVWVSCKVFITGRELRDYKETLV